jgi:hypothetical protein
MWLLQIALELLHFMLLALSCLASWITLLVLFLLCPRTRHMYTSYLLPGVNLALLPVVTSVRGVQGLLTRSLLEFCLSSICAKAKRSPIVLPGTVCKSMARVVEFKFEALY